MLAGGTSRLFLLRYDYAFIYTPTKKPQSGIMVSTTNQSMARSSGSFGGSTAFIVFFTVRVKVS